MGCPECERLEAQRLIAVSALTGAIQAKRLTVESGKPLHPVFLEYLLDTESKASAAMAELAEHRAVHNNGAAGEA